MNKDMLMRRNNLWEVPPGWREKKDKKIKREIRKLKLNNLFNNNEY